MGTQIVEIQPRELNFTFEVKKQSSCAVHLANLTDEYVAFKVKTTSPKKYCVRPNIGIIKPKSTCDFTVTMQAQKTAPVDMQCKDKFLVQSTVVPFGSSEDDILPGMFSKDSGKYIEESKLRVVLTSPPHSPVLLPVNGLPKQEPSYEPLVQKDKMLDGVENLPPQIAKKVDDAKSETKLEDFRFPKVENVKFVPAKDGEYTSAKDGDFSPEKVVESRPDMDAEETKLNLTKDVEQMKSKLSELTSKLVEAERTIAKLKEERSSTMQEKETVKQELAMLRRKAGGKRVQAGFPPLFVCMVALIFLAIGLLLRS